MPANAQPEFCKDLPDLTTLGLLASAPGPPDAMLSAFTGYRLGDSAQSTPEDVFRAVERARVAQLAWATASTPSHRLRFLRRLRALMYTQNSLFQLALMRACGLGPLDAVHEQSATGRLLASCSAAYRNGFFAIRIPWSARCPTRGRPLDGDAVMASCVDPARPLASLVEGVVPALVTGHCVITQVDEHTLPITLRLAWLARAAGLPDHTWQFVSSTGPGGSALRATLAEHTDAQAPQCCPPGPSHVSAPYPTSRGLLIVRHDADIRAAARAAVGASFARAGRHCAATPLIVVHACHSDAFLHCFKEATRKHSARMNQLSKLSDSQARWMAQWMQETIEAGAHPVHGVPLQPRPHHTFEPVILSAPVAHQAIPNPAPHAPVALVTRYTAWSEALHLARHAGPHAGVFTRTRIHQLLPQFATLPLTRIRLNAAPQPGLLPRDAFGALTRTRTAE
ncbi:aldehyde dehydrogenase family protein [Streptomyces sp. NPDC003016]